MSESNVHIQLRQKQDYQFDVQFGAQVPSLLADEPAPLGNGVGPSPVQLLAAAVGTCLSSPYNSQASGPAISAMIAGANQKLTRRLSQVARAVTRRIALVLMRLLVRPALPGTERPGYATGNTY